MIKKITYIIVSLSLMSGVVNATDNLSKLVETKIERAPAPVVVPVATSPFFKIVYKLFKQGMKSLSKGTDDAIIKALRYGVDDNIKSFDDLLKNFDYDRYINRYIKLKIDRYEGLIMEDVLEKWLTEALGHAFYKEMLDEGKKIKKFDAMEWGTRIKTIMEKVKRSTREENKYLFFIANKKEYDIAIDILSKNEYPRLTLEELSGRVRAEVIVRTKTTKKRIYTKRLGKDDPRIKNYEPVKIFDEDGKLETSAYWDESNNYITEKYINKKPIEGMFNDNGAQMYEDLPRPIRVEKIIDNGYGTEIIETYKDGEPVCRIIKYNEKIMSKGIINPKTGKWKSIHYGVDGKPIKE